MSTRFAPVVDLDIGTAILVETDLVKADVDFVVTEKVPMITLELNDSAKKYSSLFHWNDTITLSAEGDVRFLGRIDSYIPSYNKQGARILTVKGRHTGSAALEDYVANLQVSGIPKVIINAILAQYTSMRGTTYTADPVITVVSDLDDLPDDVTFGFDWRRKSFWKMFSELQQALGAPVAEGGKNEFYDFFFNPAVLGDFYFLPVGTIDSSVVIPESTETLHAKRTLDGLPVKNNIFMWAHATAGAVPYPMQIGWNKAQHYDPAIPYLTDPWTEGNASDYGGHNNSEKPDPTIADYPIPPIAYGEDRMVGSQCIRISGIIGAIGGMGSIPPIMRSAYWYMNFAHGGKFHTDRKSVV